METPELNPEAIPEIEPILPKLKSKVCACCGRDLPISEYNRHNKSKDGYAYYCKECNIKKKKESRDRLKAAKQRFAAVVPVNYNKADKTNPDSPLAAFTPRELIDELERRGYFGDLHFRVDIKVGGHK